MSTRLAVRLIVVAASAWLGGSVRGGEVETDLLTVNQQTVLKGLVSVTNEVISTIADTNNPILVLTFDSDSDGVVFDATTNGNDGLAYGGYSYTNGHGTGSALVLNGTNGYVEIPCTTQFQMSNYTLVAWVRTASAGSGRRRIISHQYESYWILALYGNVLEMGSYMAGVLDTKGSALNSNAWVMVAVVRDTTAGVARWNVNGVDVGTQAFTNKAPDASTTSGIIVGKVHNGAEYFGGTLDDVRVYNSALSTNSLLALYTGTNSYSAVTNTSALSITVPATIRHLVPLGDVGMGTFTSGP
jgi:hypothetical protein